MIVNQSGGLVHYVQEESSISWSFDARGLLRAVVKKDRKYKRGFCGRLQEIKFEPAPGVRRKKARFIENEKAGDLIKKFHREAQEKSAAAGKKNKFRELTGEYDEQKYRENAEKFRRIWGQIPILPPDQYRALVFNFTSGCSYNRCNFCEFYRGEEFDWKAPAKFQKHLERGLSFFGPTLPFFTEIFLGSGDLLAAPPEAVVEALKLVRRCPELEGMPVHCFGPGFLGRRYGGDDLRKLVKRGLQRIYFGLESGSRQVLQLLDKPFVPAEFRDSFRLCRQAGAAVGIIILLGAGGRDYFTEQIEETVRLLNGLDIGEEDRIFLSPLAEGKVGWAPGGDVEALTGEEKLKQAELLKEKIDYPLPVAGYDVEDFMY